MKTIPIPYVIVNTQVCNLEGLYKLIINKSVQRGYLRLDHQLTSSTQYIYMGEQSKVTSFKIYINPNLKRIDPLYPHSEAIFANILNMMIQILKDHHITIDIGNTLDEENHHLILYTDDEYLTLHLNDKNITFTYYYTNKE